MRQGILLAAFGAGNPQSQSTIQLFDARVRARFANLPVRWAFTSPILRERLAAVKKKTDSVTKALQKMCFEKYTHIVVQPLQTIPGKEYADVLHAVDRVCRTQPTVRMAVGGPLLATQADVAATAQAVVHHVPEERAPDEPVVFMGHGAEHPAVACYADLAKAVRALDSQVYVGAMHGAVTLETILPHLPFGASGKRVWLLPLLSTVGRHALTDMAGADVSSWRSRIEARGCPCVPVLKGTAEYTAFMDIWIEHLAQALHRVCEKNGEGICASATHSPC